MFFKVGINSFNKKTQTNKQKTNKKTHTHPKKKPNHQTCCKLKLPKFAWFALFKILMKF